MAQGGSVQRLNLSGVPMAVFEHGRTIETKWPAKCSHCKEAVPVNTKIVYYGCKEYYHPGCLDALRKEHIQD